jgi:hypothetical protein
MHEAMDAMIPIREAACGLRTQLEDEDGFSPAAAEYLAVRYVQQCMRGLRLTVSVDIAGEPEDDPRAESDRL